MRIIGMQVCVFLQQAISRFSAPRLFVYLHIMLQLIAFAIILVLPPLTQDAGRVFYRLPYNGASLLKKARDHVMLPNWIMIEKRDEPALKPP